jgi:oxygen-independent coproporphyrinogen-3 oxidase
VDAPPWGLYVHIPFCVRKCAYCDFNSGPASEETRHRYLAALHREIALSPWRGEPARTVYFGGGTPSELSPEELCAVLESVRRAFRIEDGAEITLEANPGTVSRDQLVEIRRAGFNRISFGVQSLSDARLAAIGRIHTAAEARAAVVDARAGGFDSVSIDLMFGLPGQDLAEWSDTLRGARAMGADHLSVYGLIVEQATEFGRLAARGALELPSDEIEARMYSLAEEQLADAGYAQYEISNWARRGHESRHNLIYWRNERYLGFGVSAASYDGKRRWTNTPSQREYARRVHRGESALDSAERLEPREALGETAMLALRLNEGLDLDRLSLRFGTDAEATYTKAIRRSVSRGLIERRHRSIRLTPLGRLLASDVMADFL